MDFPIDFIMSWVDGSDELWLKKKNKYDENIATNDDGNNRYRDYGLLKNWFDRVWKFAPWVHQVFLVTDNQAPDWAKKDKRIKVVNHSDFIPEKYLPTFNSSAIEMNLWRINDLSEHFVYFNDDMYISQPLKPQDFFSNRGLPVLNGSMRPVIPRDDFSKIIFNNMVLVNELYPKNKYFKKNCGKYLSLKEYGIKRFLESCTAIPYSNWVGFVEDHLAYPNLKSWFRKLNRVKPEVFEITSGHRFRNTNDYSIWLLKNLYVASGQFCPRSSKLGEMMGLKNRKDLRTVKKIMATKKMVVINDSLDNSNAEEIIEELNKIMEV